MVLFQHSKLKKKRQLSFIALIAICLLASTKGLLAQGFIEVPVKLDIEKGHLDNGVIIKVQKDGKDAFTQSGSSKIKFKLNFNSNYTLFFSKEGYITKTIQFDTHAPSSRIKTGFDPYTIGVKLYPQESDEHRVMYNQAVGYIHYDKDLDEFNFETDYSKSILSNMGDDKMASNTSKDSMQNEATPAPEKLSAKEERRNKKKLEEQKAEEEKLALQEKKEILKQKAEKEKEAKTTLAHRTTQKENNEKLHSSRDQNSDPMTAMSGSGGQDAGIKINQGSANDVNKPRLPNDGNDVSKNEPKDDGNDVPPKVWPPIGGTDPSGGKITASNGNETQGEQQYDERENITREDIVEDKRVITIIKVTKHNVTTEYRRVTYRWGGLYFFQDSKLSISENVFAFYTGVKE